MTWPIISLFITAVNSPLGVSERERGRERERLRERDVFIYSEREHSQHQFVSHLITSFMVNHVLFEKGLWTCDWIINSRLVGSDQTAACWMSAMKWTLSIFFITLTYTCCDTVLKPLIQHVSALFIRHVTKQLTRSFKLTFYFLLVFQSAVFKQINRLPAYLYI